MNMIMILVTFWRLVSGEGEGVGLGSENLSSPLLLSKLLSLKANLFLTSETREAKIGIGLRDGNKAKSIIVFAY